ncbi:hypothetical protein BGZ65_008225 [Modicella reniformis]|uniref:Uncharacterized protein n=1 Tax=Modicella reniformis TaxID=1440133 RepID=A0A9P6IN53_9FUNG|nr:hypothetical protein BGZ65_008225 [Modicella reniformis]
MEAPILFSAASRKSVLGSSSATTFSNSLAPSSLSSQASAGLGITAFSAHNRPQNSPFFNSNGLNIVPTLQGDVGRSDMSLAFEIVDRCTVDLQQLQQRYSVVAAQLNEATTKALDSDVRLAQLGAQIELELKHELEKQQLPELRRTMRATQELISRLSQLSTSAAAGSATAVVVAPKIRTTTVMTQEPNTGMVQVTGSSGTAALGSGSTTSAAALALAKLAESGHAQIADQGTLTDNSTLRKRRAGFEDGHHGSGSNSDMDINSTQHGSRKRFADAGSSVVSASEPSNDGTFR